MSLWMFFFIGFMSDIIWSSLDLRSAKHDHDERDKAEDAESILDEEEPLPDTSTFGDMYDGHDLATLACLTFQLNATCSTAAIKSGYLSNHPSNILRISPKSSPLHVRPNIGIVFPANR